MNFEMCCMIQQVAIVMIATDRIVPEHGSFNRSLLIDSNFHSQFVRPVGVSGREEWFHSGAMNTGTVHGLPSLCFITQTVLLHATLCTGAVLFISNVPRPVSYLQVWTSSPPSNTGFTPRLTLFPSGITYFWNGPISNAVKIVSVF